MNLNLTKKQKFYLCRMAALQFPGSVYNYSTKHPIHFLEQRADVLLPLDITDYTPEEMVLIEYDDGNFLSRHSVDELVAEYLGIDSDDQKEVDEYNKEAEKNGEILFIPSEKALDDNIIPGYDACIFEIEDYLKAYGLRPECVRMYSLPYAWEVEALSFTHKGAEEMQKELANHLFRPIRYYAATTCDGDFPALMGVLQMCANACLEEASAGVNWTTKTSLTPEEVVSRFENTPNEEFLAADYMVTLSAGTKLNGKEISTAELQVKTAGEMHRFGDTVIPIAKSQVILTCDAGTFTCPYPFECDKTLEALQEKDNVMRLFNFAYYCNATMEDFGK